MVRVAPDVMVLHLNSPQRASAVPGRAVHRHLLKEARQSRERSACLVSRRSFSMAIPRTTTSFSSCNLRNYGGPFSEHVSPA